jgi:hypothetical protein
MALTSQAAGTGIKERSRGDIDLLFSHLWPGHSLSPLDSLGLGHEGAKRT